MSCDILVAVSVYVFYQIKKMNEYSILDWICKYLHLPIQSESASYLFCEC